VTGEESGPGDRPALSVVVAVHDVQRWLEPCLRSVAACVPQGTEVIVVDDGSTDDSGRMCDAFAAGRPGWRVVHQQNAGLGAARNAGLDAATGEFVGFVDGDDELLPAYAALLARAQASGAHVATGAVQRLEGRRRWPSGLHAQALRGVGAVARLADEPSLLYDTTAWNKVYRRSFLVEHGLRFPEGVLYEDLPVTVRALYFAGPVECVHEPVYLWRTREGERSITQRRNELANLTDRFRAVRDVDAFLEQEGLHTLRDAHDVKVLRLDLPLYTSALPEADDAYRAAYLSFFHHLVAGLAPGRRQSLPPTLRLYVELADAGRMDDLVRAVRARRGERAWAQDERGLAQRARDEVAAYRLEHELGLAGVPQIMRHAASRAVKSVLPRSARVALTTRTPGRGARTAR
jgi:CDP-glycerol glycerophosphotransferase